MVIKQISQLACANRAFFFRGRSGCPQKYKCPVQDDEYNYHDSLQAYLIAGIEHFCAVERARSDGVFLSRQMHQNYTIVFFSE